MIQGRLLCSYVLTIAASATGCSAWEAEEGLYRGDGGDDGSSCPQAFDPDLAEEATVIHGFRVAGNRIHDSEGRPVRLRGVNRSGSEYQCAKGSGFFDGAVGEEAVRAMARWKINAVRVPLNETCWLSGGGLSASYSGENYKTAIRSYVRLLERYGLVPILDLHWAAPGDGVAGELWPMPNADHTADFWADVAKAFLDDDAVIFELYNEPYPDRNSASDAAWKCWRDGCSGCANWGGQTYEAAGMQALVDAIRGTGSEHLLLLGGVQYSNGLSGWLEYKPEDPIDNLAAAWHIYNYNPCMTEDCWNGVPLQLSEEYPIVVTELGQRDCVGGFVSQLVDWLEAREIGYLAWSWNAFGACVPDNGQGSSGNPYSLITSYACPKPNGGFADTFYHALEEYAP